MRRESAVMASEPLERVALAVLAAGFVGAMLVQAIAGLAGVLAGSGWVHTPLGDVPAIVGRMPHHLANPRAAWPAGLRGELPGAALIYGVTSAMAMAVACAAAVAVRLLGRREQGGARWAERRELRPLLVCAPQPGRITLGRHGRRLLAAEPGQSLLVVAPTQRGKTSALAVPAILEWGGPVIALSVKTDLLAHTVGHRSRLGEVAVFDPTGSTGLEKTASWTPLLACRDWAGARRVARWLADGASPGKRGLADGDFWYSAAAKLLAPLLFAAATSGLTMDAVVEWIDTQDESAVLQALEATRCDAALQAMQANWARDDRQRSSIYTTAETVLEAYADPAVLLHSRAPEITADRLLDGRSNTLYLCASAREQRRLRPVFVALLEEMLDAAYARVGRADHPLDPPLLLILDEVANIAPLPDLDILVSTAASHGVQLVTVLQDLAQAHDRWGRERADTIVNNHRAKLLGAGLADERSLEWVARLLGDEETRQRSTTIDAYGGRSVSDQRDRHPLAPANVVREADVGTALLVYGNLRPAWVTLRPWFLDRTLRRRGTRTAQAANGEQRTPDPFR